MEKNISFSQGEEKREELELPTLHFVVMDQWLDVIGEKALLAWLKFYTWCDRDRKKGDKPVDINLWEESKIPDSFAKIRKKLGVGNDTFYNKILKPLWNVGLIDIEEWAEDPRSGQKAMNIIVYKYPQNNKKLSFSKIAEVRNYDTDYSSTSKSFAKKGGRPKKDFEELPENELNNLVDDALDNLMDDVSPRGVLSQNGGGSLPEQGGFSPRTGGVLSQNGGGSQIGDNNILNISNHSFNSLNNTLNTITNDLNMLNNSFNSSSSSKEKKEEEEKEINKFTINYLEEELKYSPYTIREIIKHMKINKVHTFTAKQMDDQHEKIKEWGKTKKIHDFGYFFVNGILKDEAFNLIMAQNERLTHATTVDTQKPFQPQKEPPVPFYNWLEN